MPPVQLAYNDYVECAVAGMIAEGPDAGRLIESEIATVAIGPGLVLTRTASTQSGVEYPNAVADLARAAAAGVSVNSPGQIPSLAAGHVLYEAKDIVPAMKKGKAYLISETAMTKGLHPYVRCVAAGAEKLGAVRNDADTSDAFVCPWLIVDETTTAAGLVRCKVDVDRALTTQEFNALYPPGADNQVLTSNGTNWGSEA